MKKILFLFGSFFITGAFAQELIVLPSSFDENQMIVKKMDANGNFVPLDQSELQEKTMQKSKFNPVKRPQPDVGRTTFPQHSQEKRNDRKPQNIQGNFETFDAQSLPPENPNPRVRKLRAVEKDYSMPKTTFSASTHEKVEIPTNTTFQIPTMEKAMSDFKRESINFEECDSDDPNCKIYEVDEAGQVIFK